MPPTRMTHPFLSTSLIQNRYKNISLESPALIRIQKVPMKKIISKGVTRAPAHVRTEEKMASSNRIQHGKKNICQMSIMLILYLPVFSVLVKWPSFTDLPGISPVNFRCSDAYATNCNKHAYAILLHLYCSVTCSVLFCPADLSSGCVRHGCFYTVEMSGICSYKAKDLHLGF